MMKRRLLLVIVMLATPWALQALPKFASRLGLSCQGCHVNPTGGGMRNSFGAASFAVEDLPIPSWQEEFALEGSSPQLNDVISIGADLRTLYFLEQQPVSTRSSFFQMQADLYISARLAKKTALSINRGLGDRFEVFGITGILPFNGYVKAGWFSPAYGLRMDDHNILTRSQTLFAFGRGQDAGVEIAFSPGWLTLTGSVTNGSSLDRDNNRAKAVLGRAETQILLPPIGVRFGGSYYNSAGSVGTTTLYGAFAAASLGRNLTVLAEIDRRRQMEHASGVTTTALVTFVEADYLVVQGLDLKAGYDFYDPDTKLRTGSEARIYLGVEFYPVTGVEVRPLYIFRREEPTEAKNDQLILMLHFFF
jgi:hypothetical protein